MTQTTGNGTGYDWASRAIESGRMLQDRLSEPAFLKATADRLTTVAVDLGCGWVAGASEEGHRLAGAVAVASEGRLAIWSNGRVGEVLILEGVLASGAQILHAARSARAHGATRTAAAAVIADPDGLQRCRRELGDEVIALEAL